MSERGSRRIGADSSSLILLQKCALLPQLLDYYSVWVSEAVYDEVALPAKTGAGELARLLRCRRLQADTGGVAESMGRGEKETIALYLQGSVDFLLLDDGKAAGFCRRRRIPFINSLLLPRLLAAADLLTEPSARQAFASLVGLGYYSREVVARAGRMLPADLQPFLPF